LVDKGSGGLMIGLGELRSRKNRCEDSTQVSKRFPGVEELAK
jgi:hypothetical protein